LTLSKSDLDLGTLSQEIDDPSYSPGASQAPARFSRSSRNSAKSELKKPDIFGAILVIMVFFFVVLAGISGFLFFGFLNMPPVNEPASQPQSLKPKDRIASKARPNKQPASYLAREEDVWGSVKPVAQKEEFLSKQEAPTQKEVVASTNPSPNINATLPTPVALETENKVTVEKEIPVTTNNNVALSSEMANPAPEPSTPHFYEQGLDPKPVGSELISSHNLSTLLESESVAFYELPLPEPPQQVTSIANNVSESTPSIDVLSDLDLEALAQIADVSSKEPIPYDISLDGLGRELLTNYQLEPQAPLALDNKVNFSEITQKNLLEDTGNKISESTPSIDVLSDLDIEALPQIADVSGKEPIPYDISLDGLNKELLTNYQLEAQAPLALDNKVNFSEITQKNLLEDTGNKVSESTPSIDVLSDLDIEVLPQIADISGKEPLPYDISLDGLSRELLTNYQLEAQGPLALDNKANFSEITPRNLLESRRVPENNPVEALAFEEVPENNEVLANAQPPINVPSGIESQPAAESMGFENYFPFDFSAKALDQTTFFELPFENRSVSLTTNNEIPSPTIDILSDLEVGEKASPSHVVDIANVQPQPMDLSLFQELENPNYLFDSSVSLERQDKPALQTEKTSQIVLDNTPTESIDKPAVAQSIASESQPNQLIANVEAANAADLNALKEEKTTPLPQSLQVGSVVSQATVPQETQTASKQVSLEQKVNEAKNKLEDALDTVALTPVSPKGQQIKEVNVVQDQERAPILSKKERYLNAENKKLADEKIQNIVRKLRLSGFVNRASNSRFLLNNIIFSLGDTFDHANHELTWVDIDPSERLLFFSDKNGAYYCKKF